MSTPPEPPYAAPFRCPKPGCGSASWHPRDCAEGYCGRCHWWTGDPRMSTPDGLPIVDTLEDHDA